MPIVPFKPRIQNKDLADFSSRALLLILFVLMAAGVVVRAADLTAPFEGPHERNSAFYTVSARNMVRHGVVSLNGAMIVDGGETLSETPEIYANHSPLLAMGLAGVIGLVGDSSAAVRLYAIALSLLGLPFFFDACRRLNGGRFAVAGGVVWVLAPMAVYYGQVVNFEPVVVSLMAVGAWCHLRFWRGEKQKQFWTALVLVSFLAGLVDWSGFFYPVLLTLMDRGRSGRFLRRHAVLLGAAVAAQLIVAAQILQVSGGLGNLLHQGLFRSGLGSGGVEFTLFTFLEREFYWGLLLFGLPAVILALFAGTRGSGKGGWFSDGSVFVLPLFGAALLNVIVFPNGAWIHDYWLYLFLPSVAYGAAAGLKCLLSSPPENARPRWVAPAAVILILFFFLQSAVVARHKFDVGGGYEREINAAKLIQSSTSGSEVILTDLEMDMTYLSYLTDRRFRRVDTFDALEPAIVNDTPSPRWFLTNLEEPSGAGDVVGWLRLQEFLHQEVRQWVEEGDWILYDLHFLVTGGNVACRTNNDSTETM